MKRQTGIRVKLSLFIPYDKTDLEGMGRAIEASKTLRTREGLTNLAGLPSVEIESSSAESTSRETKAA